MAFLHLTPECRFDLFSGEGHLEIQNAQAVRNEPVPKRGEHARPTPRRHAVGHRIEHLCDLSLVHRWRSHHAFELFDDPRPLPLQIQSMRHIPARIAER